MKQPLHRALFFAASLLITNLTYSQVDSIAIDTSASVNTSIDTTKMDKTKGMDSVSGVAVSPSHVHLNLKPGEEKDVKVTITNSTDKTNSFKISMVDFDMNQAGKSMFLPPDPNRLYSLSRWSSIAPTFIELGPGEKRKVSIKVSIPETEDGNKAAWTIVMVEQQVPRERLDPSDNGGETVAFGVVPTFAFGVYLYQNPPTVDNNNVEIIGFKHEDKDSLNTISIKANNAGDGIAYCVSYVDLTNVTTGFQKRLMVKRFTIVPGLERSFKFLVPSDIPKGDYVAVGVIDYKNADEIKAAKTKFKID